VLKYIAGEENNVEVKTEGEVDPRWAALKNLKKN
jgi:uncharacterized metal-binding protein YceD (DUF177 family)